MPSLQVRELPEPVYRKLKQEAARKNRTLVQQAIVTLSKGLAISSDPKGRRENVLRSLESDAEILSKYKLTNPASMIRENRER